MLTQFSAFVRDEHGFVVTTELVLIATLCVLGLVTGISCIRDAVNGELNDVAQAIGSLNQSYRFAGFHGCVSPKCGVHAWTAGSVFTDLRDEEGRAGLDDGPAVEVPVKPTPKPEVCPPQVEKVEPQPAMVTNPCPAPVMETISGPVVDSTCCQPVSALPCGPTLPAPECCGAPVVTAPLTVPNVCAPRITVSPEIPGCSSPISGEFQVW